MYYNLKFRQTRKLFRANRLDLLCAMYRVPFEKVQKNTTALRNETKRKRENTRCMLLSKLRFERIYLQEQQDEIARKEKNEKAMVGKVWAVDETVYGLEQESVKPSGKLPVDDDRKQANKGAVHGNRDTGWYQI